jgi:hypothetical protein
MPTGTGQDEVVKLLVEILTEVKKQISSSTPAAPAVDTTKIDTLRKQLLKPTPTS